MRNGETNITTSLDKTCKIQRGGGGGVEAQFSSYHSIRGTEAKITRGELGRTQKQTKRENEDNRVDFQKRERNCTINRNSASRKLRKFSHPCTETGEKVRRLSQERSAELFKKRRRIPEDLHQNHPTTQRSRTYRSTPLSSLLKGGRRRESDLCSPLVQHKGAYTVRLRGIKAAAEKVSKSSCAPKSGREEPRIRPEATSTEPNENQKKGSPKLRTMDWAKGVLKKRRPGGLI